MSSNKARRSLSSLFSSPTKPSSEVPVGSKKRDRSPLRDGLFGSSPQSQRRRLSFDQGSSSTVASVGDAPSVATKDTGDRFLPVTLESLADLLVKIQSGQERTAARVASIDDHLTSISLTLEGLALNQRKLEKAIQAVTEESTQTARSLKETKRDTELVTDHVRNLDAAMASLHDTLIEVRRDAEVTFMISGLEARRLTVKMLWTKSRVLSRNYAWLMPRTSWQRTEWAQPSLVE